MKKLTATLGMVIVAIGVYLLFSSYYGKGSIGENMPSGDQSQIAKKDYKNTAYIVNGQKIALVEGVSEIEAAPGSSSKITTRYFGNEVKYDIDNDGREDIFFIITQNTGGSGTFYYVVAALNKADGYVGSDAVLLGDRIAPQSTVRGEKNIVIVNYADRAISDSFAVAPSIGKSIWLKLDIATMKLGEVAQNFEGEADPSKMTLTMKTWNWFETSYSSKPDTIPAKQNVFKITFKKDGTFSASTDCNGIGGEYTATAKGVIKLDKMISTLMFCEGSQETEFREMLTNVNAYQFNSKGELLLKIKNSGTMVWK